MRIVIDFMIGLMLVAVVAGGLYLYNSREQNRQDVESVRVALQQFQQQAAYHRTVQSAVAGRDVLLVHLHPEWFGDNVPANVLLYGDRPWIDLAPPGDLGEHPPDPVVHGEEQAGFWYNPTTGVFRARVSPASSEALTLSLYNEVNGTALAAFEQIPDPSRQPLAHVLGKTPATQYASMANMTWSELSAPQVSLETDLLTEAPGEGFDLIPDTPGQEINPESVENQEEANTHNSPGQTAPKGEEPESVPTKRPTLELQ
ncbi:MAG: hypothetical protein AAGI37_07020 [Planctomycetota bacterium]